MASHTSFGLRLWRELSRAIIETVTLGACAACGAAGTELCRPCRRLLQRVLEPGCPRCGVPTPNGARCGDDHARLRNLALARAPFGYAGTGGALVRRLKFQRDRGALRILARAMTDRVRGWAGREGRRAVIVGVPLHRSKRRQRGIDQAAALGDAIATALGRRFVSGALRRVRATLPQADPRVTSRERNVAGVFRIRRRRAVRNRDVILVDDVMTSGSTARACAKVLRDAGARRVVLLTACRARS